MAAAAPVSILLPVYNAASTLPAALKSIQEQSYADFECIVVDDGSNDDTADQLESLPAKDPRFRMIRQTHTGITEALNTGLAATRGEWIARMDADDLSHPERLARQVDVLAADPMIGLVGCRVRYGGDRQAQAGYARYVDWTNQLIHPEAISMNRFIESPIPHPSVMFRRDLVDRLGNYRHGDFPEDYDCWLRWLEAGVQMTKVDAELLTWNDPPGRLSRVDPRYRPEAFYAHKAIFLARWLKRCNPHHPKVYIWGSGRIARQRAAHLLPHGITFVAYIDVAPGKQGHLVDGVPVIAPEQLPDPSAAFVLPYVAKRGAREEIQSWLLEQGFLAGQHFISAA